jgi:hypothetical protein
LCIRGLRLCPTGCPIIPSSLVVAFNILYFVALSNRDASNFQDIIGETAEKL